MRYTYLVIGITAIVSWMCFSDRTRFVRLAFIPSLMRRNLGKEWYRFISHGFVHSDYAHLIFNMLTLYFFGPDLELLLNGGLEFIWFYFSAMVAASLISYFRHRDEPNYISVGASGAVSAVVMALVLVYPWHTIYLSFFVPIYFVLYAVFFFIYSAYMGRSNRDNIAHDVHIAGAIYGLLYMAILHPRYFQNFWFQIQNPPFLG